MPVVSVALTYRVSKTHVTFSQTYPKPPKVLFSTNGLSVLLTENLGVINHEFSVKINTTGFEVQQIYPIDKMEQYPVCFLVVPPYD